MVDPLSDLCIGCGRNVAEIAAWPDLGEPERLAIMAVLEDRLRAARSRSRRGGRVSVRASDP